MAQNGRQGSATGRTNSTGDRAGAGSAGRGGSGSSSGRGSSRRRRVVIGSRAVGDEPTRDGGSRGGSRRGGSGTGRTRDAGTGGGSGRGRSGSGGGRSGGDRTGGSRASGSGSGSGGGRNPRRGRNDGTPDRTPDRRPERTQDRPAAPAADTNAGAPAAPTSVDTSVTFGDLGIPLEMCRSLASEGIEHPFPIQAAAIPDAVAGRDVLGRGPTGSGKTLTFGLPMLTGLRGAASKPGRPRGLILVPTRELAHQVAERLEPLAAALGQRVLPVVGGVNIKRNLTALARPVDLLVATPGRAQDLVNQKALALGDVSVVTLDEADQMADMGFLPQVRTLLAHVPGNAQHLFFSATLDGDIRVLVDEIMVDPVTHSTTGGEAQVDSTEHRLGVVPDRETRNEVVLDLGQRATKTIMFMRTKHGVDRQAKKLVRAGVRAVALHGDKGQNSRMRSIADFTSGDATVLVATDIAARGIDIKGVDLVVHVDPPAEHKAYVHRAGRTGRAGASGQVLTLTFAADKAETLAMMRKAGVDPQVVETTRTGTDGATDLLSRTDLP